MDDGGLGRHDDAMGPQDLLEVEGLANVGSFGAIGLHQFMKAWMACRVSSVARRSK